MTDPQQGGQPWQSYPDPAAGAPSQPQSQPQSQPYGQPYGQPHGPAQPGPPYPGAVPDPGQAQPQPGQPTPAQAGPYGPGSPVASPASPAYPGQPVEHPAQYPAAGSYPGQAPAYPGQPVTGAPAGYAPTQPIGPFGVGAPAPAKRGPWVLILAIVSVLLLIATGVMTGLYVSKSGAHSDAVAARDRNADERDAARKALETLKGDSADLEEANEALKECVKLFLEGIDLIVAGNTAAANAKLNEAANVCMAARRYTR